MKFYRLNYTTVARDPNGKKITRRRTQYCTAKDPALVIEECKLRHGKYLMTAEVKEIAQSAIKPNTKIYVVYGI